MKRSRIFLGITTIMLAIAGVAAAKMLNYGSKFRVYFTNKSAMHRCMPYILTACTKNGPGPQCSFDYPFTTYFLYTNPSCSTYAFYRQG